jgi:hypothetical protein
MSERKRGVKSAGSLGSGAPPGCEAEFSLRSHGDELERDHWDRLEPYVQKYEAIWRILVAPLRRPHSTWFREGIDEDFEEFAMCHYTAYVNLARALNKMTSREDDLKFSDEIWSNMQHSGEVATKSIAAYRRIHLACSMPRRDPRINTAQLESSKGVLKKYRNALHDPIIGTAKQAGVRLLPKRERLEHYHRWTTVMYCRDE